MKGAYNVVKIILETPHSSARSVQPPSPTGEGYNKVNILNKNLSVSTYGIATSPFNGRGLYCGTDYL
jgi:hypothetical protein